MKKLILSAALVLGSLTTFASTPVLNSNSALVSVTQDDYKEITLDQIPEAVTASLTKAYPTAKVEKAYVNEANEYKLEIATADVKSTVYADAKGNWIKK
jgi:hypothetical protein